MGSGYYLPGESPAELEYERKLNSYKKSGPISKLSFWNDVEPDEFDKLIKRYYSNPEVIIQHFENLHNEDFIVENTN